jgi:plasmid stabilization system protein ParE
MTVVYHPAVQNDVNRILERYDAVSQELGDDFWDELERCIEATAENPGRSHLADRGLRRVNLKRFPYHFLFRLLPGKIRMIVVRHNRRKPSYGLRRR